MTEKELDENLKNSLNLIEKWGEENKPPTLYKIIHDELGYSHDCTAEIIDAVKEWIPPSSPRNTYDWERCLKLMREKLE